MKQEHLGGDFDSFLQTEGNFNEATTVAVKRVIAWKIEQKAKAQDLTNSEMASNIENSPPARNRLTGKSTKP